MNNGKHLWIFSISYLCSILFCAVASSMAVPSPKKQATQFFISHVATLSASCRRRAGLTHAPSPFSLLQVFASGLRWHINFWCHGIILIAPCYSQQQIKIQVKRKRKKIYIRRQRPLKCHYIFIHFMNVVRMRVCVSVWVCVWVCVLLCSEIL